MSSSHAYNLDYVSPAVIEIDNHNIYAVKTFY